MVNLMILIYNINDFADLNIFEIYWKSKVT